MATYLILSSIFLAIAIAIVLLSNWRPNRVWLIGLFVLIILTLIFDSLIILFDIVGYDINRISGIYIWEAPLEDFFYTVVAALIVPVLWHSVKAYDSKKGSGNG